MDRFVSFLRRRFLSLAFFLLTFLLGFFVTVPAYADTYTLSGNVSESTGADIDGATINVIDTSNNTTVASTTTNSEGNYSTSIEEGIYNVQVTPPAGSNFSSAVALSQNINSDKVLNFILVPAGTVTVSGYVYDSAGNPLANQQIQLRSSSPQIDGATDASGSFSITAQAGTYDIVIRSCTVGILNNIPQCYSLFVQQYVLTQSIITDITLPTKTVIVHVQDNLGNPLSNITIKADRQSGVGCSEPGMVIGENLTASGCNSSSTYGLSGPGPTTGANGNATLLLFPSSHPPYILTAVPPSGSNFATKSLTTSISGDITLTITLPKSVTISGYVYDSAGNPLANQQIQLRSSSPQIDVTTDGSGFYSATALAGDYDIVVRSCTVGISNNIPQCYSLFVRQYTLTQNTVADIMLPTRSVTVHVQDGFGNPVNNIGIKAQRQSGVGCSQADFSIGGNLIASGCNSDSSYGFSGQVPTTNSSGNVTLQLLASSNPPYIFTAIPPNGSSFATTSITVGITEDTIVTVTLPQSVIFSGHIYDPSGHPLVNQQIQLRSSSPQIDGTTDALGNYAVTALAGIYDINFRSCTVSILNNVPQCYSLFVPQYALGQNTVADITLPTKTVTVHVQDNLGNPLSNITIKADRQSGVGCSEPGMVIGENLTASGCNSSSTYGLSGPGPTTDANGNATLLLFPSSHPPYILTAVPPSGSIYAQFTLDNVVVVGDQTEIISLQYNHATPVTTIDLATQHQDGTYSDPTIVTISATADTGYTIANIFYKVDGGIQQMYMEPFTVSGNGEHTIEYWSVDNSGVQEASRTETFTIYVNQAPYVDPFSGAMINAGETFSASSYFTDPDSTSWTATVDYGEGTGPEVLTLNPDKTFNLSHQYTTPGEYTVTVVVTDDGQATGMTLATVSVNAQPIIDTLPDETMEEGDNYSATGTFTDPDSINWTATVDYGEGAGTQTLALNPDNTFVLTNIYEDNGTYNVVVTITDDNGAVDTETVVVAVTNANPQVGTITALVNPIQVFSATSTKASFTDAGILDTHTAVWDWGDGMTSPGDIVESNGSGTVTGDHVYLAAGVYEVTLTVTDNNNASDVEVYQYLSVYDPTPQGLFNGVRKFTTPAGSYTADPSLAGQVMFGVSAKYQGTDPIGDVSMSFNAAGFEFESTGITTLVIANGSEATIRGTGEVNGTPGYTFLVTGLDGGSGGDDFVRFQIKDAANNIVFDSQTGAGDTADPTALITAGNVVIH